MWFDGPNQILQIFHHLMWFDGPKKLMWFDGPKSSFSPFKTSCVLMDPKPHVVWWTLIRIFKVFPSQNLMWFDGPTTQLNLMCFGGPKTSCGLMDPWWFSGSIKPHEVFGSTKTRVHKKLMWFNGPRFSNLIGSIKPHEVCSAVVAHFGWVHQITWAPDKESAFGLITHLLVYD